MYVQISCLVASGLISGRLLCFQAWLVAQTHVKDAVSTAQDIRCPVTFTTLCQDPPRGECLLCLSGILVKNELQLLT